MNDTGAACRQLRFAASASLLFATACVSAPEPPLPGVLPALDWRMLPQIPAEPYRSVQIGRSGMCAGAIGGTIVLLGGSNFPDAAKTATRGGVKAYYADGFQFDIAGERWQIIGPTLPVAGDQFLSLSASRSVYCIAGMRGEPGGSAPSRTAWRIDIRSKRITATALPDLPEEIGRPVGGIWNEHLIVASPTRVYGLRPGDTQPAWRPLFHLPWASRQGFSMIVADGRLYVFGGQEPAGDDSRFLTDTYEYSPELKTWVRRTDLPRPLSTAVAFAGDAAGIWVVGSVTAAAVTTIRDLRRRRDAAPAGSPGRRRLNDALTLRFDHHEGFSPQVYRYDTHADRWSRAGWHPGPSPIKVTPVTVGERAYLFGGEVSPGKRTSMAWQVHEL